MWQQLSGSDKSRFVCYVIGLPAAVLALILFAMGHQWVRAAISAVLVFGLSYSLYKLSHGKENRRVAQSIQAPPRPRRRPTRLPPM